MVTINNCVTFQRAVDLSARIQYLCRRQLNVPVGQAPTGIWTAAAT